MEVLILKTRATILAPAVKLVAVLNPVWCKSSVPEAELERSLPIVARKVRSLGSPEPLGAAATGSK